jgi:hypothetical protein
MKKIKYYIIIILLISICISSIRGQNIFYVLIFMSPHIIYLSLFDFLINFILNRSIRIGNNFVNRLIFSILVIFILFIIIFLFEIISYYGFNIQQILNSKYLLNLFQDNFLIYILYILVFNFLNSNLQLHCRLTKGR